MNSSPGFHCLVEENTMFFKSHPMHHAVDGMAAILRAKMLRSHKHTF
jgi:hypothetical protein